MVEAERTEDPGQPAAPLALLHGQPLVDLPEGLYIPPDALEVFLESFEGPLHLLLYLIRQQNLNILDLPLVEITDQYVRYVSMMEELDLELASEYLVMAAMLAEIKSRMLLPAPEEEADEEGGDPRAELIRQLLEYERFQTAAQNLNNLQRLERDVFSFTLNTENLAVPRPLPKVELQDLLLALEAMLLRVQYNVAHEIEPERLSVQDRMSDILSRLHENDRCWFTDLLAREEGRQGMAVTLLAILELMRLRLLECDQKESGGPIEVVALARPPEEQAEHA